MTKQTKIDILKIFGIVFTTTFISLWALSYVI